MSNVPEKVVADDIIRIGSRRQKPLSSLGIAQQRIADQIIEEHGGRWEELPYWLQVREWLKDLSSDAYPSTVTLVEVDGAHYKQGLRLFRYFYLGERISETVTDDDTYILTHEGVTIDVWAIRIFRDGTDAFAEIRNPRLDTGTMIMTDPDPRQLGAHSLFLPALEPLGMRRKPGHPSLAEVVEPEEFRSRYRDALVTVRHRKLGKRPTQLEIACELAMSERTLRRYIRMFGLPEELLA